jgi:hypothetical protein
MTSDIETRMFPMLEDPELVPLLPIPEPRPVETRDSTVDSQIAMSPTLEPSDPYPPPIPELLVPVASTIEFAIIMALARETPSVQ